MARTAAFALLLAAPLGGAAAVFLHVPEVAGLSDLPCVMLLAFALGMLAGTRGVAYGFVVYGGVLGCASAVALALASVQGVS